MTSSTTNIMINTHMCKRRWWHSWTKWRYQFLLCVLYIFIGF